MEIQAMDPDGAHACLEALAALLQDAVESGASVGFLPPLELPAAREYWLKVIEAMRAGHRVLLVAKEERRMVGAVQLDLATMPNGRHRAEVMKLFVHREARGRGIGRALMIAIEQAARDAGRSLLVLDTRLGDAAERLYASHGYLRAGVIPRYARSASGDLDGTVFFYKELI